MRVRIQNAADLDLAGRLAEQRHRIVLELPASLYPSWQAMEVTCGRILPLERVLLDQSFEELSPDFLDRMAEKRFSVLVPPSANAGVVAHRLATCGAWVIMHDPRSWSPVALAQLARAYIKDSRNLSIGPLVATLRYVWPKGEAFSLSEFYEEAGASCLWVSPDGAVATSQQHAEAGEYLGRIGDSLAGAEPRGHRQPVGACLTCSAQKCCRGFWLVLENPEEHCETWREIVDNFARTAHGET